MFRPFFFFCFITASAVCVICINGETLFYFSGAAAVESAVQVHDYRELRQDQGGVQFFTGPVSHVSVIVLLAASERERNFIAY